MSAAAKDGRADYVRPLLRQTAPVRLPEAWDDQVRTVYMPPYLAQEIARQREDESRRSARRYSQLRRRRMRRRGSARHRAGWVLIEIGLTLVHSSGDG